MPRIMISYRRADSAGWANHLAENLRSTFGSGNVFLDIESIEPGLDFVEVLERQLDTCDVVLAVIGPSWLHSTAEGTRSRLEDEHDFVRLELSRALRRNIRLIPVLVGGAVLPPPAQLPDDLADLVRRQAFELSDTRWPQDMIRLTNVLRTVRTDLKPATLASSLRTLGLAALAMVIAGGAAGAATIHFNLLLTPPSGQRPIAAVAANPSASTPSAAVAALAPGGTSSARASAIPSTGSTAKATDSAAPAPQLIDINGSFKEGRDGPTGWGRVSSTAGAQSGSRVMYLPWDASLGAVSVKDPPDSPAGWSLQRPYPLAPKGATSITTNARCRSDGRALNSSSAEGGTNRRRGVPLLTIYGWTEVAGSTTRGEVLSSVQMDCGSESKLTIGRAALTPNALATGGYSIELGLDGPWQAQVWFSDVTLSFS